MLRARGIHGPALLGLTMLMAVPAFGQVVPGTGQKVANFGDDFEDVKWSYVTNGNKSSQEEDGRTRGPLGFSRNGRWIESAKRGHPDYVARVETPAGGLPGSKGSLRMQSKHTGVPGRPSRVMKQDDFLCRNYEVAPAQNPNYVVRVYLPPFEHWENRSGSTFGFRIGCRAPKSQMNERRGFFESLNIFEEEAYWPGMFISFLSSHDGKRKNDAAVLLCRGGRSGQEFEGPFLKPGWWTLGLSVSPDGAVHYYASPGVDRLTARDRVGSSFPYNLRAERVTTMFFNICSPDDGQSWSTSWIIDDPSMYVTGGGGVAGLPGMIPERQRKRGGLFGLFR